MESEHGCKQHCVRDHKDPPRSRYACFERGPRSNDSASWDRRILFGMTPAVPAHNGRVLDVLSAQWALLHDPLRGRVLSGPHSQLYGDMNTIVCRPIVFKTPIYWACGAICLRRSDDASVSSGIRRESRKRNWPLGPGCTAITSAAWNAVSATSASPPRGS